MTRYTDHEWRQMESDPKWDRHEPAVPTVPFDQWIADEARQRIDDIVAELVDQGWGHDEAWIAAKQIEEDGP